MTISYKVAADAALVLNFGESNQSIVSGLSKIGLPGLERSVIEVQEFRNAFSRQFAGGGKQGLLNYGGNLVTGDTNGQNMLKSYLYVNTKMYKTRAYLNYADFLTIDLAQDSISAMQVTKANTGEADLNGVFPYTGEIVLNGRPATFFVHMADVATPTITFLQGSGTDDTIIDSASGFVTAGFVAGQSILIDGIGTDNKNKYGVLKTVAAGTLTLDGEGLIETDAVGDALTVIHGGLL